jgi:RNA polymerase sigma factor for flagellar operon FliA
MNGLQATKRDQLISEHTDMARRIALKMARRCPGWIAREDLVAAGYLGLTEAAARYDETRTEPFPSFAEHRIRGAILDELRRGDIMPRRVRQLARKVTTAIRDLEQGGSTPSEQNIAEALGVSVETYRNGLAQLVNCEVESLDGGEGMLRADASENPELVASNRQTLSRVREALSRLEQRDVTILALHYLEELSYPEIAKTLSITPSRVCQLLWRAIDRLRTQLGAEQMAAAA